MSIAPSVSDSCSTAIRNGSVKIYDRGGKNLFCALHEDFCCHYYAFTHCLVNSLVGDPLGPHVLPNQQINMSAFREEIILIGIVS